MTTTAPAPRRTQRWRALIPTIVLAVLAIGIALYAVPRYLLGGPEDSAVPLGADEALHFFVLGVHALPSGIALMIGPFQFIAPLRTRFPHLHRISGRIYVISVAVGAAAGIVAAILTVDGFTAQVAFIFLNVAWLYSLGKAYSTIRRGEVQLHRVWMTRNYALTFSAVTLRVFLVTGLSAAPSLGLDFFDIYGTATWASIFLNVVVAEYFIVQRIIAPGLKRRRPATPRSPREAVLTPAGK